MEQGREGIPSLPCWCVIIYAYNPVSFHLFRDQNQGQNYKRTTTAIVTIAVVVYLF